MKLYISTRDTDGMAIKFEKWVNKNHPEIKTEIEKNGAQTVLIDENGNVEDQSFWCDFCND